MPDDPLWLKDRVSFNPSIGLTSVPTNGQLTSSTKSAMFQSLNRAYKRSDHGTLALLAGRFQFQSLNRAYKRSDLEN